MKTLLSLLILGVFFQTVNAMEEQILKPVVIEEKKEQTKNVCLKCLRELEDRVELVTVACCKRSFHKDCMDWQEGKQDWICPSCKKNNDLFTIKESPQVVINEEKKEQTNNECSICIEELNNSNEITANCCQKPFCQKCVGAWKLKKESEWGCPLCRNTDKRFIIKELLKLTLVEEEKKEQTGNNCSRQALIEEKVLIGEKKEQTENNGPQPVPIEEKILIGEKKEQIKGNCPICQYELKEADELVTVACCDNYLHKKCRNQFKVEGIKTICPYCRSNEKELIIKEEVTCGICQGKCGALDRVIQVSCTHPVVFSDKAVDWFKGGNTSLFSVAYATLGTVFTIEEPVVHCFHEQCLRNYYATNKKGHDYLKKYIYYCPIHNEKEIALPASLNNLQLVDKTQMTQEEIDAIVKQEEAREKRLRNL